MNPLLIPNSMESFPTSDSANSWLYYSGDAQVLFYLGSIEWSAEKGLNKKLLNWSRPNFL